MEYRVLRQEGSRVTLHAVKFEKLNPETVSTPDYFELVDSTPRGLDVEGVPCI